MTTKHLAQLLGSSAILLAAHAARAQDQGPPPAQTPTPAQSPDPGGGTPTDQPAQPGQPGTSPQVVVVEQAPATRVNYPGALPPIGFNPDSYLPSSSQTLKGSMEAGDSFDLGQHTGPSGPVRGSANGQFVPESQTTPEGYTVRRGDTLFEIAGRYFGNPYDWPRMWAYNAQIQNPHWIYPGDRVRLREPRSPQTRAALLGGLHGKRAVVPPQTIFLRETGWIDDRKEDTWGELVGATADGMMLTEGDDVYLQLEPGHDLEVGRELTIFSPVRSMEGTGVAGELVSIRGTARIDRINEKTRMARARVIEALDVIERGAKVGPVGRKFEVVPPIIGDQDLEAKLVASLYPNEFFGQNQVVFIDRGAKDGVRPGQRFFAVRRGDPWAQLIDTAGQMVLKRPRIEDERPAQVDDMHVETDDSRFPDETYAEIRVLRTQDHTAAALVVASKREIPRGARFVARKGM